MYPVHVDSMDEVRPLIHPAFKDKSLEIVTGNHNSDPFRFLWRRFYDAPTIIALDVSAWPHDWGYAYARLPGSGLEHITRKQWDRLYAKDVVRQAIARGASYESAIRAKRLQYRGLRLGGFVAWHRNKRMMRRMGDATFGDYERRKAAEAEAGNGPSDERAGALS